MKYNDKLRLFFKNKGLSQKDVSIRLGHAPAMISRFLSGESVFGPDFIISLIKEFPEIDLHYIFSEDDTTNPAQVALPFQGLTNDNLDRELEIIGKKVANVRDFLAQN